MPAAAASSSASAPRSSEPQGSWMTTLSATPASSGGGASAAATTNIAFGQAATCGRPRGTAGRLGHGVRVGVDADDEPGRVGGSGGQHVTAVAGAEVDHDPAVPARRVAS